MQVFTCIIRRGAPHVKYILTKPGYNDLIKNRMKEVITMNRNDKEFLVQKIRTPYMAKEPSQLDELKALDKK